MQPVLFDTSIYITALRLEDEAALGFRRIAAGAPVWLSSVVLEELYAGVSPRSRRVVERLERDFDRARRILVPNLRDWTRTRSPCREVRLRADREGTLDQRRADCNVRRSFGDNRDNGRRARFQEACRVPALPVADRKTAIQLILFSTGRKTTFMRFAGGNRVQPMFRSHRRRSFTHTSTRPSDRRASPAAPASRRQARQFPPAGTRQGRARQDRSV